MTRALLASALLLLLSACNRGAKKPIPRAQEPFVPAFDIARTVDDLLPDLRSPDPDKRTQARFNLSRRSADAAPRLAAMLADPDADARREAAWALAGMGPRAALAIGPLEEALHDRDAEVRRHALEAFAGMGASIVPASAVLVKLALGGPPEIAPAVAPTLVRYAGEAGESAFITALRETDTDKLLHLFVSLDDPPRSGTRDFAVWILDRALRSEKDAVIRLQAARLLGRLDRSRALALEGLVDAALHDPDAGVRTAAEETLRRIGEVDRDVREQELARLQQGR